MDPDGRGVLLSGDGLAVIAVAPSGVTVWLVASGATFGQRYTPPYAASVFFSAGAVLYLYRTAFHAIRLDRLTAAALFAVFCVTPLLTDWAGLPKYYVGFYGPALLFVPILVTAMALKSGAWDRWVGDLAYPVFILHMFAAGLLRIVFPLALQPLSATFFVATYALSVLLSIGLVRLSRRWLDPVRSEIRPAAPVAAGGAL